jgi:hypothetical protein
MFTSIIIFALLSVLYGLAWHNEPPRQHTVVPHPNRTHEPHD